MITVDAAELIAFGRAAAAAPDRMRQELVITTQALGAEGVAMAQENAPIMDGALRNSIQIIRSGELDVEFGTSLIYANQREYGGTIRPKKGKYLWFRVGGKLVRARQVTQRGSFYMRRTVSQLQPVVFLAYQRAVNRVINDLGW